MALTDKTGAPVTVDEEADRFTISLEGTVVGLTAYQVRGRQRVFFHTEVDDAFGGRGLATVLIGEALTKTRAQGWRIVPVCPTVTAYVKEHPEFDDVVDRPTMDLLGEFRRAAKARRRAPAEPPAPDPRAPTP
jgi:predicted GNAT family acetyltransferase